MDRQEDMMDMKGRSKGTASTKAASEDKDGYSGSAFLLTRSYHGVGVSRHGHLRFSFLHPRG